MNFTFEGRSLDLGDILLRQREDGSGRDEVKVTSFEHFDDGVRPSAVYTLRLTRRPWTEYYRVTFAEIEQTCIREPSNVDRRTPHQRGRRDYD